MIASTVTLLLATRWSARIPYTHTENRYDYDYNIIETDEPGPFVTPVYYGDTCAIPAENFERLFWLISTHTHQALLLWHHQIQGP